MRAYIFILLVAATVTYLTTPAARRLARRIGAVTPVRDRDVHTVPIPRLGGTAIFLGVAIGLLTASQLGFFSKLFEEQGRATHAVLLSAFAVCLLGVFDDIWQLDAITKFAGQALASGLMAWQGIQLLSLPIFGTFIPSRGLLIVVTVIAIVVTINAVNFVDGLDGLAAGMVAIAGSAFFIYSYVLTRESSDDYASLASLIVAALVGACLGFLPHNFNPARIFMGDSGSMLIGLLLATSTVSITGTVQPSVLSEYKIVPAFLPLVLPLAVLALPLIDLALAVIRRTRAGRSFWTPDKLHLHHRMLSMGHSHAGAVLVLYFWTGTVGFGVALFALVKPSTAFLVGGIAVSTALVLTLGPLRGRRRLGPGGPVAATAAGPSVSPAGGAASPETGSGTGPDGANASDLPDTMPSGIRLPAGGVTPSDPSSAAPAGARPARPSSSSASAVAGRVSEARVGAFGKLPDETGMNTGGRRA